MHTTLHIDGANCSICFNEALQDLAQIEGVGAVQGSFAGSCIEIEHDDDVPVDVLAATIRDHVHGIAMYANEVRMVPLDPVSAPCAHQTV
jgi:copper chaperone CopZ